MYSSFTSRLAFGFMTLSSFDIRQLQFHRRHPTSRCPFLGRNTCQMPVISALLAWARAPTFPLRKARQNLRPENPWRNKFEPTCKWFQTTTPVRSPALPGAETLERFQSLAREVTNTTIGDIRTRWREDIRQLDDRTYRVHMWPWKSKRKPCSVS